MVELVYNFIKLKKSLINQALIENGVLNSILGFLVHFEWNNQLLIQIDRIITFIFEEDLKEL